MLDQPILHEESEFLARVAGSIVTSEDPVAFPNSEKIIPNSLMTALDVEFGIFLMIRYLEK